MAAFTQLGAKASYHRKGTTVALFDKFTWRAHKVCELAAERAMRLKQNYIGGEHFLFAILEVEDSVAVRVLRQLGMDLESIRRELEFFGECFEPEQKEAAAELYLTPSAKKALWMAIDESQRFNHGYVGTEHLLLGLLREEGGAASLLLMWKFGIELDRVRELVEHTVSFHDPRPIVREEFPRPPQPPPRILPPKDPRSD